MKVCVLLFSAAREIAGCDSAELNLPESATVAQAKSALLHALPVLAARNGILLWAVNNDYASDDHVLKGTDVVACFPPVSGG